MKKLISFIMVFFAALVLIGCTPEEGVNKLATPVIKAVENNIVYWGSVDNAVSYVVNVDDKYEQNTTDLNFDLGKVLSVSTSGVVKVKAKGNGVTFTDSDWSNEFNYEFVKDNGGNNNQNTQKQKLATPVITGYSNNTVAWNAVENASGYVVRINGVEYNAYTTTYVITFDNSCSFTVQVKAIPNTGSEKYLDSEWSYVSNYQYVKDNETEDEMYVKMGVGSTIDVVQATKYGDFKVGVEVLDNDKLKDNNYDKVPHSGGDISSKSYKSIEEVYDKGSVSFEFSRDKDSNKKVLGFVRTYNVNFKANTTIEYKNIKDSYYFILDDYKYLYKLSLRESLYNKDVLDVLSEDFLEYLDNLGNDPSLEDYYALFEKYGTHLITKGIYGGRFNAYYTVVNKTNKFSVDAMAKLDYTAKKAASKNNSTTTNITVELANYFEENNVEVESNFKLSYNGGGSVGATSLDDLSQAYTKWTNSLNDNPSNVALIDFTEDGLLPLWELLPEEKYGYMKESMYNAFLKYYDDYYISYIKEFSYNNTIDYAGGSGLPSDPYLISNAVHLHNIELNLDSNYKIINDIDLSVYKNWNAIGGHYKKDDLMFNGILDGDGHIISNMTRTSDIAEKDDRTYFGLFGRVGKEGVIRNIIFENVNVYVTGPKENNGDMYLFFGVVAGALYGEVSDVTIKSGKFGYDCHTNGIAYVGGIAGTAIDCKIKNCENNIDLICCRDFSAVGGIAGFAADADIEYCTNNGNLEAQCLSTKEAFAGGLVGEGCETRPNDYPGSLNNGKLVAKKGWGSIFGAETNTDDEQANAVSGVRE